jgi:hypothetical protein
MVLLLCSCTTTMFFVTPLLTDLNLGQFHFSFVLFSIVAHGNGHHQLKRREGSQDHSSGIEFRIIHIFITTPRGIEVSVLIIKKIFTKI